MYFENTAQFAGKTPYIRIHCSKTFDTTYLFQRNNNYVLIPRNDIVGVFEWVHLPTILSVLDCRFRERRWETEERGITENLYERFLLYPMQIHIRNNLILRKYWRMKRPDLLAPRVFTQP